MSDRFTPSAADASTHLSLSKTHAVPVRVQVTLPLDRALAGEGHPGTAADPGRPQDARHQSSIC